MATTTKTLAPTNQTITIPDMTERPNASVLTDGISKEADAINALNSKLSSFSYFPIDNGTDLNTLLTAGFYSCATGSGAQSLVNCPATSNFTMLVMRKGDLFNQIIFCNGFEIYARSQGTAGWGDWVNFHGTRV